MILPASAVGHILNHFENNLMDHSQLIGKLTLNSDRLVVVNHCPSSQTSSPNDVMARVSAYGSEMLNAAQNTHGNSCKKINVAKDKFSISKFKFKLSLGNIKLV